MTDTIQSYHNPYDAEKERERYFYDRARAGRIDKGNSEMFGKFTAQFRTWSIFPYEQNGSSYIIAAEPGDHESGIKKMAVHEAVRIVTGRGFRLPRDTGFYLVGDEGVGGIKVNNQAFHWDGAGNPTCTVTLGTTAAKGGSGKGISAQATTGYAPATKVVLHELGHTFHAHNVGRVRFYTDPRLRETNQAVGAQVSEYARANIAKEIIAETFLGMMIGRQYADDVMRFYGIKGGPRIMHGSGREGFGMRN